MRILEHHEIQPYEVALVHWENEEINYTIGQYVRLPPLDLIYYLPPTSCCCCKKPYNTFLLQRKHKARARQLYSER